MITRRLLEALAAPRVQPHFHIPVQSGSDRVLAAVRRPYKAQRVLRAVRELREVKEDPFIAADIIAGLPGEGAEDFRASLRLLEECRFSALHVFPFSPRPGTEAEHAGERVPERVIGERAGQLRELGERLQREYLERWRGREVEAVLERRSDPAVATAGVEGAADRPSGAPTTPETWTALSANYLHLIVTGVPTGEGRSGALCRVEIEPPEAAGENSDPETGALPASYLSREPG
jgi:tRNA A37 methylthiotransferase MiaB